MTQSADQILWLLISTTLLTLVVPGVALFYGGMVRKKNVINTMALPFVALAVVSLVWGLVGNGLASGTIGGEPGGPERLLSLNRGMMASVALVAGAAVAAVSVKVPQRSPSPLVGKSVAEGDG